MADTTGPQQTIQYIIDRWGTPIEKPPALTHLREYVNDAGNALASTPLNASRSQLRGAISDALSYLIAAKAMIDSLDGHFADREDPPSETPSSTAAGITLHR